MYDRKRTITPTLTRASTVPAGFLVRSLTPDDARELSYLELEIFPTPWSENSLRACLELRNVEGEAILADNQIVAYLFVQFAADEAHILNIGVLNSFRRQGLATLLLNRFLPRAKKLGADYCYLEVRSGNLGAQKLYYNHGFMPISVRKGYYPNGEDALILMRRL